jgi:hypothetical protein
MSVPASGIYPERGVISGFTCATLHYNPPPNSTMSEPKSGDSSQQPPNLPLTPTLSSIETKAPDVTVAEQAAQPQQSPPPLTHPVEDRLALLSRARVFLASPQVQHQNLPAKRAFLAEKGLNETEIDSLLREVVSSLSPSYRFSVNLRGYTQPAPALNIPPRTYPQPPPSNLPVLLLGIVRLFTWLAGGSAVLVLLYQVRISVPDISDCMFMAFYSVYSFQESLRLLWLAILSSLTNFLC